LIAGRAEVDDDAVKTLPSDLGHAVARATSPNDDTRYRNVGELASAIARYAPPGHLSARNIALLMSRAGIVGSPQSIPISQRTTSPNVEVAPPPSSRRVPVGAQLRGEPGINEEWFAPPPTRPRRSRISDLPAAPPARKAGAFAAVALLLLGATLGGTLYLYRSGELPQWSGTAPPSDEGKMEPISRTEVTNALIETTQMTPPTALENALIEPVKKPITTTTDDDIEVTESPSTAAPMETKPDTKPADQAEPAAPSAAAKKAPQLGSGPAMPPSTSKSKKSPTTDDDTPPAQPWAGTSPPATTSSPTTDEADDTASRSAPPTAPTTTPTTPPSEEPRITDEPGF
jgi:hypothetical protein